MSVITFSRKVTFLRLFFILTLLKHLCPKLVICPQTCYHWAAKGNQTDKRIYIRYKLKISVFLDVIPILQQPFYKLLTQRLWSVIEAAIFPWRLTRSLPGALQEPITFLWFISFQLTAWSRNDFFLLLFWFCNFSCLRLAVETWTLHCCGLSACYI